MYVGLMGFCNWNPEFLCIDIKVYNLIPGTS